MNARHLSTARPSAAGVVPGPYTAAMPRAARPAITPAAGIAIAAVLAAVLALAQVALAEWTGITTLTESFQAGGEDIVGQQQSLVAWFCGLSTMIAVATVAHRFGERRALRLAIAVAAAVGSLAVIPLINARTNYYYIEDDMTNGAIRGAAIGAVASLIVSRNWRVGIGVAIHAAMVWAAGGLTTGLVWDSTYVFAGMVKFHDWVALEDRLSSSIGDDAPTMLPFAGAVVLVAGLLAGWLARRGATRREAVEAAVAGPVLAVVMYMAGGLEMENGDAAPVAALAALAALGTAVLGAAVGRRRDPAAVPRTG